MPDTLYHWWRGPEPGEDTGRKGVPAIIGFDLESGGTVYEHNGDVYLFTNGWQNAPLYRIHGWDGIERAAMTVNVTSHPSHAVGEGSGLEEAYYLNTSLSGEPATERTDRQVSAPVFPKPLCCSSWPGLMIMPTDTDGVVFYPALKKGHLDENVKRIGGSSSTIAEFSPPSFWKSYIYL